MDQASSLSAGLSVTPENDSRDAFVAEKYRVLRTLRRCATSTSYVCRDEARDRQVVLKLLRREWSAQAGVNARFARQVPPALALEHTNVRRLLGSGRTLLGELYLVLEHASGRDLERVLLEESPLSDARVIDIVSQVLSGLSAGHAIGLVHGELSPRRIAFTDAEPSAPGSERVVLDDFVTASAVPARPSATGARPHTEDTEQRLEMPTAAYLSPEQARGDALDARSDVYSAGVLLFRLLTGTEPFKADNPVRLAVMHCVTPPPPPSQYTRVNPMLEAICLRALSKTREARYQSAAQMQEALLAAAHSGEDSNAVARHSWLVPVPAAALVAHEFAGSSPSLAPTERTVQPAARARTAGVMVVAVAAVAMLALLGLSDLRDPSSESATSDEPALEAQPTAAASDAPASDLSARAAPVRGPVNAAPKTNAATATPEANVEAAAPADQPQAGDDVSTRALAGSALTAAVASDPRAVPERAEVATTVRPASRRSRTAQGAKQRARAASPDPRLAPVHIPEPPATARAEASEPTRPVDLASQTLAESLLEVQRAFDPTAAGSTPPPAAASTPGPQTAEAAPAVSQPPVAPSAPPSAAARVATGDKAVTSNPAADRASGQEPAKAARPPAEPPRPLATDEARVVIGAINSHSGVSRASVRNALNQTGLDQCYRAALTRGDASALPVHVTLELTTGMSGRVDSAVLRGAALSRSLQQCIEQVVRAGRVRDVDTGAATASAELTFQPR